MILGTALHALRWISGNPSCPRWASFHFSYPPIPRRAPLPLRCSKVPYRCRQFVPLFPPTETPLRVFGRCLPKDFDRCVKAFAPSIIAFFVCGGGTSPFPCRDACQGPSSAGERLFLSNVFPHRCLAGLPAACCLPSPFPMEVLNSRNRKHPINRCPWNTTRASRERDSLFAPPTVRFFP